MTKTVIRRAGAADARRLAELFALACPNSSHPLQRIEDAEPLLEDSRNYVVIAEDGGDLAASMAMTYFPWNRSYELGRALTRPAYRRQGLAAGLAQRVLDWVCDHGLGEVFFGYPRIRSIAKLVACLTPRMVAVGHDAGRNVGSGAGEVHLKRMWLTATERQLAVHPIATLPYLFSILLRAGGSGLDDTTSCELRRLRRRYEDLFHLEPTPAEVLLFRVGSPDVSPPPSRRRPLADVLTGGCRSSFDHVRRD